MRIGIVADSACDLPADFIERENITILPVTIQIGQAVLADTRNDEATMTFLSGETAARAFEAESTPFTVQQVHDLFLTKLVHDYDYVFCITTTRTRSGIYDNAVQASYTILNDYKPVRAASGNTTPFALRVIDSQNVFAAVGVLVVEAARLRAAGETPPKIRARLENLALYTQGYMVPPRPALPAQPHQEARRQERELPQRRAGHRAGHQADPALQPRRDRPGRQGQGLRTTRSRRCSTSPPAACVPA